VKIAIRNLKRNRVYSLINIFGLSIGIAAVILIFLFIQDELSFDKFHKKSDKIYRLFTNFHNPGGSVNWKNRSVVIPHGPVMKDFFPEVIECVRTYPRSYTIKCGDFIENQQILLADEGFFEMFSFPLISGNPENVLTYPNSLILSESYAFRYFGSDDPVGKTITLISGEYSNDFTVTGVAEDTPSNSTIKYTMLIPFECMRFFGNARRLERWQSWSSAMQTYIEVRDENSLTGILNRYPAFARQYYTATFDGMRDIVFEGVESSKDPMSFGLQKMKNIRLDPQINGYPDLTKIYILSGIALGILIIACINFITQSLGLAAKRFTEVGIRKVVGARKVQLVRQFLTESVIIVFLAAAAGFIIAAFALPVFNEISEKSLVISNLFSISNCLLIISLMILIGICAGSYPAFILSNLKPVTILKGKLRLGGKNRLTQILVTAQFVCSVFFIISTIILGKQIDYMINTNLGYEKENILIIQTQLNNRDSNENLYNLFKSRVEMYPGITNITGASSAFSMSNNVDIIQQNEKRYDTKVVQIKYDYFKTLGIDFSEGRDFSENFSTDTSGVVVNETLINRFGIENPVGKPLEGYRIPLNIIGVIKDIHYRSLRSEILPTIYFINPRQGINFIILKISENQVSSTLELLSSTWKELQPDRPFLYSFLDKEVEYQYASDKKWKSVLQYSTIFAIMIACMGIFGLISISINEKVKEICIRKIHGAKIIGLIALLSKESLKLILIANIIAWPIVWYSMNKWLENFAYKLDLPLYVFIWAALLTICLVFVSISYQTIKAARANPVDSLRYE
jgi:putative ABC transport system permease protein